MLHIMAIDAIIVHDMKINEYSVHFSVYFQRVTPSEKVEIVSTLYFNTAKNYSKRNSVLWLQMTRFLHRLERFRFVF